MFKKKTNFMDPEVWISYNFTSQNISIENTNGNISFDNTNIDAQIKALSDINNMMNDTKADNLVYEDNTLQLVANGKKIGDAVNIKSCDNYEENGVPVVDFNKLTGSTTPDDESKDNLDNVVEF